MKGHTHIIRANGREEHQDHSARLSLEFLQSAVGGYIEAIDWPGGVAAFCNEEGKLNGLPINPKANALWNNPHDVLVGDIVIVTGDAAFMRAL